MSTDELWTWEALATGERAVDRGKSEGLPGGAVDRGELEGGPRGDPWNMGSLMEFQLRDSGKEAI